MAKRLDAMAIAEKQLRRAQAATSDYQAGIENVTEAPTHRAARKKDKYRAGVQAALDSGKYEEGLMAVGLEEWKDAAKKKGGDRYASGVAASAPKVQAFWAEFAPFQEAAKKEIDALPDATLDQRLQKMVANAKKMATFRRTRRRR